MFAIEKSCMLDLENKSKDKTTMKLWVSLLPAPHSSGSLLPFAEQHFTVVLLCPDSPAASSLVAFLVHSWMLPMLVMITIIYNQVTTLNFLYTYSILTYHMVI